MIARRADDIEDFEMRLRGCIQALAYSHDLLVQHDWQGATLEELLRVQLAPFGGIDGGRFVVERAAGLSAAAGDAVARPDHARACHQRDQAWRAVEPGRVGRDRLGRRERDGVKLTWQERGGPPVEPPRRKGFGQVVFERIGASLDGDIAIDFPPEGFVCAVTIGAENLLPHQRRCARLPHSAIQPCIDVRNVCLFQSSWQEVRQSGLR